MTTTPVPQQSRDVRRQLRWVLAAAWLVAPAWAFLRAFELLFTLFGESPSAAEQAEAAGWLVLAGALAVGIPAGALALGGRRAWWVALGFSLALCAMLAPAVAGATAR